MPKKEPLPLQGKLFRFVPTEKDVRSLPQKKRIRMLFELLLIREFETRLLELKDAGLVHGPVHSSIGQEGAAVGVMSALDPRDAVASTHRGIIISWPKRWGITCRTTIPRQLLLLI